MPLSSAVRTAPPRPAASAPATDLAVFGCTPDELEAFTALAPRFGLAAALTADPASADAVQASGARCISVAHRTPLSRATLAELAGAGIEHVTTRSIGVDHIDLLAARELGITVENVVYEPDGVADYTLMLLLMALRDAARAVQSTGSQEAALGARGRELRDLTVGVVGVGRIGAAVIERLRGFGCRVVANNGGRPAAAAADYLTLDELLRASDIVTLHAPLDERTRHLLDGERIASMKPGAVLVNTARGGLVDTEALIRALESGQLGGAALDVLEGEENHGSAAGARSLSRLRALPHVVVTPHTAYFTDRALADTVEQTLMKCRDFERTRHA
jgi:D-specific alpha-keto acid dehydrogenase